MSVRAYFGPHLLLLANVHQREGDDQEEKKHARMKLKLIATKYSLSLAMQRAGTMTSRHWSGGPLFIRRLGTRSVHNIPFDYIG